MNKNTAIKVQNLTKIYKLYSKPIDRLKESVHPLKKKYHKDFHALNNVSFEIKKGETVGIIGKNGSGKSTLLKMITGVITPSVGRVNIHGKISAILELGAGFNPEMSGLENIYLNTSINGMNKAQTDKKIDEIVAFAELSEFIYQPIKTYSSGMKARLAFAVSINIDPDILIVDEALSVGDVAFQRKCYAKMEEIKRNGTTILFVSHSEGSIINLCDKVIWLNEGIKVLEGNAKYLVGLYLKNINNKNLNIKKIEEEFSLINKKTKNINKEKKKFENKIKVISDEYFDSKLKPKSTIVYESKGAKIYDIKILNLDNKEVNVLVQGETYIFTYSVEFDHVNENVQFGMGFKSVQGMALGGGVFPGKEKYEKNLSKVKKINWKFSCLFNEGNFLINCGVLSEENNGDFMHRILDAYLFRVISYNKEFSKTGFVDFSLDFKVESYDK